MWIWFMSKISQLKPNVYVIIIKFQFQKQEDLDLLMSFSVSLPPPWLSTLPRA